MDESSAKETLMTNAKANEVKGGITPARLFMIIVGILVMAGYLILSSHLRSAPGDAVPVQPFDFNRLVGQWFEIARIDNEIEAGEGQLSINVVKGEAGELKLSLLDIKRKIKWESVAKYDVDDKRGSFDIPCFGPLMCGLHVVALDEKSNGWILVAGHRLDQLWIFSRTTGVQKKTLNEIKMQADEMGFDSDSLVINNHLPEQKPAIDKSDSRNGSMPGGILNAAPSQIINPETPANEPPVPLYLPPVPTVNPAVPQNIPALPKGVPVPNPG